MRKEKPLTSKDYGSLVKDYYIFNFIKGSLCYLELLLVNLSSGWHAKSTTWYNLAKISLFDLIRSLSCSSYYIFVLETNVLCHIRVNSRAYQLRQIAYKFSICVLHYYWVVPRKVKCTMNLQSFNSSLEDILKIIH